MRRTHTVTAQCHAKNESHGMAHVARPRATAALNFLIGLSLDIVDSSASLFSSFAAGDAAQFDEESKMMKREEDTIKKGMEEIRNKWV